MTARSDPDTNAPLTRDAILAQIRNADDRLVLDLLATGASAVELSSALAWLADDDAAVRAGAAAPTGAAAQVIELLRKAEETEAPSALDEP